MSLVKKAHPYPPSSIFSQHYFERDLSSEILVYYKMLAIRSLLRTNPQVLKNAVQQRNMSAIAVPARTRVSTGVSFLINFLLIFVILPVFIKLKAVFGIYNLFRSSKKLENTHFRLFDWKYLNWKLRNFFLKEVIFAISRSNFIFCIIKYLHGAVSVVVFGVEGYGFNSHLWRILKNYF